MRFLSDSTNLHVLKEDTATFTWHYHKVYLDGLTATVKSSWDYSAVAQYSNYDHPLYETTNSILMLTLTTDTNALRAELFNKTSGVHTTQIIGDNYEPINMIGDLVYSPVTIGNVVSTGTSIAYNIIDPATDTLTSGNIDLSSITTDGYLWATSRHETATTSVLMIQPNLTAVATNIPVKACVVSDTGVIQGVPIDATLADQTTRIFNFSNDYTFFISDNTLGSEKYTVLDNTGAVWLQNASIGPGRYDSILNDADEVLMVSDDATYWYLLFRRTGTGENKLFYIKKDKTDFGFTATLPSGEVKIYGDGIYLREFVSTTPTDLRMKRYSVNGVNTWDGLITTNDDLDTLQTIYFWFDETLTPNRLFAIVKNSTTGYYYKYVWDVTDVATAQPNTGTMIYHDAGNTDNFVFEYDLVDFEDTGLANETYNIKRYTVDGLDYVITNIAYADIETHTSFNQNAGVSINYHGNGTDITVNFEYL